MNFQIFLELLSYHLIDSFDLFESVSHHCPLLISLFIVVKWLFTFWKRVFLLSKVEATEILDISDFYISVNSLCNFSFCKTVFHNFSFCKTFFGAFCIQKVLFTLISRFLGLFLLYSFLCLFGQSRFVLRAFNELRVLFQMPRFIKKLQKFKIALSVLNLTFIFHFSLLYLFIFCYVSIFLVISVIIIEIPCSSMRWGKKLTPCSTMVGVEASVVWNWPSRKEENTFFL